MAFCASSGIAPGEVAPLATPSVATLVHPMKLAGAGPHVRQYWSEQVSAPPQRAPDEQHFSASCPQRPVSPPVVLPVPPVVLPALLALLVLLVLLQPPRQARWPRKTAPRTLIEIMLSILPVPA